MFFASEYAKSKMKQTKLEKYGNEHFVNPKKALQTRANKFGSIENSYKQQAIKYTETCIKKYGVENIASLPEIRDKISSKQIENWQNLSEEEKSEIARKISEANKNKIPWNKNKKLGHIPEDKKQQILEKQYKTKQLNSSFNSSKPEDSYKAYLVEKYGENDIYTQYIDKVRYPFACDFYIKSLDLFIELNLHWSHGGHAFNANNEMDIKKLATWEEKAKQSDFYRNAIETWTVRDVLKFKTAKQNKLNYIVYYNESELYDD